MIKPYLLKSLLTLCLIAFFTGMLPAEANSFQKEDNAFPQEVLKGRSFVVTFTLGEEENTDILTFGEDGSFTMEALSKIKNSTGIYINVCGILFLANFSGSFPGNPFSFSFYGIYLTPEIVGFDVIDWFGSAYRGTFSGTELNK